MPVGEERGPRRARRVALLALAACLAACGIATSAAGAVLTLYTDQPAGPPLMGLGVQWDPYDSFVPTQADWNLTFRRLDFLKPGFIRVVEPAYDYFAGYDSSHNPRYRWNSPHLVQLRTILDYAKSRGITVVLGDWGNPMLGGDARIPADFLAQLHDVYGYTNIKYYNLINEPNYAEGCDFACWTGMVKALSTQFAASGLSWLSLVGPDNGNSWDDTPDVQARDRTTGLDGDNPIGGDQWLTDTLGAVPSLIGAYDSHRYSTPQGLQAGVYQDQMYARREQISNLDSPSKPYFEGEVGLTARQVSPFSAGDARASRALAPLLDPSAQPHASTFVDSQPHIRQFAYGVWMGDMAIQLISAGLSGASAWDLDDAMHVGGQYGSQNLKQWGFWNSYAGQDGYPASDLRLRPWFYTWSLLARSFPAGSQALAAPTTGLPGVRIAAAKIPSDHGFAISVAVVNDSFRPRSIRLAIASARQPLTLARYDYFGTVRPVDASGFPVPSATLHDVRLSSGITVALPSRGLVILSSAGLATIGLSEGRSLLVDNLDNWRSVASRTRGLKLDHTTPLYFNGDRSRAVSTARGPQSVTYRVAGLSSFELKAYFHGALGLRVLASPDGRRWAPVALESTHPAPAMGGHGWYLAELLPAAAPRLPINQLRIELLSRSTELSQVRIASRAAAS